MSFSVLLSEASFIHDRFLVFSVCCRKPVSAVNAVIAKCVLHSKDALFSPNCCSAIPWYTRYHLPGTRYQGTRYSIFYKKLKNVSCEYYHVNG